jgi:hypothetical protein
VHHVTFTVPSLDKACRHAAAHGYEVVGYDASDPRWKEAFLHPKQALGIVVQLAEAASEEPRRPRSVAAPGATPGVQIVGLRLRAHLPEQADTQWRDVLGATRSVAPDGALTYRWPASSMAITVEIDPVQDQGPIAIEIRGERAHAFVGTGCPAGMRFSLA